MKRKIVATILISIIMIISTIFMEVRAVIVNQPAQGTNKEEKEEYITEDDLIYSNKYLVKEKVVSKIEPKTSIEEFIKNIEIAEGNDIKIYKEEKEITSGYIGTGMTVKGTNGQEYSLSVIGDISRRRSSKPNRTNNDNKTLSKPKRMGTRRNKKGIKRHKPETEK